MNHNETTLNATSKSGDDFGEITHLWQTVPFFANKAEIFAAQYWWLLLIVPVFISLIFGYQLSVLAYRGSNEATHLSRIFIITRDPYVRTLGAALAISALAFTIWQRSFRETFSKAIELGIVGDSSAETASFISLSRRFPQLIKARFRYALIGSLVVVAAAATYPGMPLFWTLQFWSFYPMLHALYLLLYLFLLIYAYGVGATAWCFLSAARWLYQLSSSDAIRIQPGHPDGCCGFEAIGNCCLQSAIPLIIGMIVCLIWSRGSKIALFRNYAEAWLTVVVPFSYIALVCLFILVCAQVFWPVYRLHIRLNSYMVDRQGRYTAALKAFLYDVDHDIAIAKQMDFGKAGDRLKIIQALDPVTLKLSSWPFDRTKLVSYGLVPVASLLLPVGKALLSAWLGIDLGK